MKDNYEIPRGEEIFEEDASLEQVANNQEVEPEPEVKPTGGRDARDKKKE
jgi:hypothetical protein